MVIISLGGKKHVNETAGNAQGIDALVPEGVEATPVVDDQALQDAFSRAATFLLLFLAL